MNEKRHQVVCGPGSEEFRREIRRTKVESKSGAAIEVKRYLLTETEKKELSIPFQLPSSSPGPKNESK